MTEHFNEILQEPRSVVNWCIVDEVGFVSFSTLSRFVVNLDKHGDVICRGDCKQRSRKINTGTVFEYNPIVVT